MNLHPRRRDAACLILWRRSKFGHPKCAATILIVAALSLSSGCRDTTQTPDAAPAPITSLSQPAEVPAVIPPAQPPAEKLTDEKPAGEQPVEPVESECAEDDAASAMRRGLDYLRAQQAPDGGWHSETYGAMRGGASITSLVLYAASHLPAGLHRDRHAKWMAGFEFLQPGIEDRGFVVCPDGSLDYPTYATAMLLTAARQLGFDDAIARRKSAITFLLSGQLAEARGFKPENPNYGGWDLQAGSDTRGITTGTNVSVTCFALEALCAIAVTRNGNEPHSAEMSQCLSRARRWVGGCQNLPGDGGFFFHPERRHHGNKAEWSDAKHEHPRSYGTATCDALRCLHYAGAEQDDPRMLAGRRWLAAHTTNIEVVPGFEDAPERIGWKDGLRFYYYMTLAKTVELLDKPRASMLREQIVARLVELQKSDGRWQNDSARMREDDPLIATSFALVALGEIARQSDQSERPAVEPLPESR